MRNLKTRKGRGNIRDDVIRSVSPSNGISSDLSHAHIVLLHLAHEFGKKSSHPSALHYSDYDSDWYRKNHISPKGRMDNLIATDGIRRKEIDKVLTERGIPNGDFKAVRNALKELQMERRINSENWKGTVKKILKNTAKEKRKVVKALTYFAGESLNISEEMHILNKKSMNLLRIAAEKRGVGKEALFALLQQKFMPKQKQVLTMK